MTTSAHQQHTEQVAGPRAFSQSTIREAQLWEQPAATMNKLVVTHIFTPMVWEEQEISLLIPSDLFYHAFNKYDKLSSRKSEVSYHIVKKKKKKRNTES